MKKFLSIMLVLTLCVCTCISAFASEVVSNGGSATTPVSLSTTTDGTLDGEPAATAMSVTVPTVFPMAMAQNGDVTTATDCKITNNSYGPVRVKSVTINAASGWKLTAFGDKASLANEKVDANKFGFSLVVGSGSAVKTDASNASTQKLISAPVTGCYLSGAGNTSGNSVSVNYNAIVTPLSSPVTNANIANVVFVIEWDTEA